MYTNIDQIDNKILNLIAQGHQINEIAEALQRSNRYILYRLSDLKISFNCKTTSQLIYILTLSGLININATKH